VGGKKKRMGPTCNKNGCERLNKISRDNVPVGRSPGCPKRRWSDLIIDLNRRNRLQRRRGRRRGRRRRRRRGRRRRN
jgi:hypothetical protein